MQEYQTWKPSATVKQFLIEDIEFNTHNSINNIQLHSNSKFNNLFLIVCFYYIEFYVMCKYLV